MATNQAAIPDQGAMTHLAPFARGRQENGGDAYKKHRQQKD
jgi:hypothetical protein